MALVTDMSGECSAGLTLHTDWKPASVARPHLVTMDAEAGPGPSIDRPTMEPRPAVVSAELRTASPHGSDGAAPCAAAAAGLGGGGAGAGGMGVGHRLVPSRTTLTERTTGSSGSST